MKYRTLTGLDYAGKRVEAGQVVDDLPESSVGWLRQGGFIEQVAEPEKPAPVVQEPVQDTRKPAKRTSKRSA